MTLKALPQSETNLAPVPTGDLPILDAADAPKALTALEAAFIDFANGTVSAETPTLIQPIVPMVNYPFILLRALAKAAKLFSLAIISSGVWRFRFTTGMKSSGLVRDFDHRLTITEA